MTVPSQTPVSTYVGNGVTTTFAYGFKLLDQVDIQVTVNGVLKTLTTDYTVTGVGVDAGGTIVFVTAPANLASIALVRKVTVQRLTDYQYSGDFQSPTVNRDFDRVVMMLQDSGVNVANAVRFPVGDSANGVLPNAVTRALKALAFDAAGNLAVVAGAGDATALAAALLSTTAVTGGALVGFDQANTYAAGTVGLALKTAAADISTFKTDVASTADAAKGTALMGYKHAAAGSVGRTLASKLGEFVSVKDFGAVGDGVAVDSAAFTNALAAASTVIVPPGTYRFSANYTVANGKRLIFRDGAQLTVDATFTLTIRGLVEAGVGQIFAGAGTVLGVKRVRPEWFGATRTGTANNDAAAFNKAQLCMEAGITSDGDEMALLLSSGDYGIGSQVVCTPNTASCIQWLGAGSHAGTRLIALAAWTGANGVLKLKADAVNSVGSACRFSGFRIIPQTAGTGSTIGILIGGDVSLTLQGGAHESCLFEDVGVYDFTQCWNIQHARGFSFRRCSAWVQTVANAFGIVISSDGASKFTGDMDFYSFQVTANGGGTPNCMYISGANSGQVAGIRFNSHIMYRGVTTIVATTAGKVSDIWFTPGWQYDVVAGTGFSIGSDGAGSKIWDLHFLGGYWAGGLIGAAKAFNLFVSNSGILRGVSITDNYFIQTWGDVVAWNGCDQIQVVRNRIVDPNAGSFANFGSSVGSIVNDNVLQRLNGSGSLVYFVTNNGSSNYYSIRNNMGCSYLTSGTVNDPSPGAQRIVDGNF